MARESRRPHAVAVGADIPSSFAARGRAANSYLAPRSRKVPWACWARGRPSYKSPQEIRPAGLGDEVRFFSDNGSRARAADLRVRPDNDDPHSSRAVEL